MYVNAVLSIPCRCCGEEEAEPIKDVTKTGSGERGTGNGSLGTSCQRKPPQKSKMAVQNTRERKKVTRMLLVDSPLETGVCRKNNSKYLLY